MRIIGILAGYGFLGLSLLIVVEILARKLLNLSIQGVDEIGGYVVAVTGTVGMALAAADRAHTRIDVLLVRLPARVQVVLNVLAYLCLAAAAAFMAYMAWTTLDESIAFNSVSSTPLQVPLSIPQSMWLGGLLLFGVTALAMAVRAVLALRRGAADAERLLAPTTVVEEIEEARR
ncbi:MAG: TRAP transporter small permease [Pseudomonadota bacterium]